MKIILYLATAIKKYRESAVAAYSGQTAFYLILSFFPFLMFFFTLLDLTPLSEADFLMWASTFVPAAFQEMLAQFSNEIYSGNTGGRISITVLTAIYLSSRAFQALQQGLNAMYQVKESRNAVMLRVYSVFYSIVFAVVMILMLGIMVFGHWLGNFFALRLPWLNRGFAFVLRFRILIGIPVLFLIFWVLYYLLPNQKQRWRQQIWGALFASAGWMLLSACFSLYVDSHSNYTSFYGTMTTLVFLLLWVYGCMYLIFLGGIINSARIDVANFRRQIRP
jgi:membrane protein